MRKITDQWGNGSVFEALEPRLLLSGAIDTGTFEVDPLPPPVVFVEMERWADYDVPGRTDDSYGYFIGVTGNDMTGGQLTTPWGETTDIADLLPPGWDGETYFGFERGAMEFSTYSDGDEMVFEFEWFWLSDSQWASLDTGVTTLNIAAGAQTWTDTLDFSSVSQVPDEPNVTSPVHRTGLSHDFLVEWSPWVAPPADGVIFVEFEEMPLDGQWTGNEYYGEFELPASATSWAPPVGLDLDGIFEVYVYFDNIAEETLNDGVTAEIFSSSGNVIVNPIGNFEKVVVEPGTGKQYFLTPRGSWESCQIYAQVHGGNLATIDSAAHEAWLASQFGENEQFWFGMNDLAVEGQWEWIDGQPVTYTNWQAGQPDDFGWDQPGADAALWWGIGQWTDMTENYWYRGIVQVNPGQWISDDHANGPTGATPIAGPGPAAGLLGYLGDIDYFSFPAVGGTLYEILVDVSASPELDTVLWLYDSDGRTLLTWDDDGGEDWSSRIRWVAPSSGTYYLAVDSYAAFDGADEAVGNYSLQINLDTLTPDSPTVSFSHPELWLDINGTRGVGVSYELYTGSTSEGDDAVMHVFDLSNPLVPVETGSRYAGSAEDGGFGPHGFFYYIADDLQVNGEEYSELVALNISGAGDPVEIYRTRLQREMAESAAIVGNLAYIVTRSYGDDWADTALEIYSLSNPTSPVLQGQTQWSYPHGDGHAVESAELVVVDSVAYMLHEEDPTLSIIDVSDPASPELLGQYASPSDTEPQGLAVVGDTAWIGMGDELHGIDISNPAAPLFRSSIGLDGKAAQILIQGDTAYVGCTSLGATVVDISSPDFPAIVDTIVTPGATGSIAVSGGSVVVPTFGDATSVFAAAVSPEVVARRLFYNNSRWDADDPAAGFGDDNAVAPDKTALLPGQTASPASYSSYSRGINGVIVDIGGIYGTPAIGDFGFRVSDPGAPGGWTTGPVPTLTVRPDNGAGGSDRVTLIWADGAIVDQWLEVTVLSNANGGSLGLTENDVFYSGSAVGDTDGDGDVDDSDYGTFVGEFGGRSGGIGGLDADFDGDGHAGLTDFAALRARFGDTVSEPTFPVPAPTVSQPLDDDITRNAADDPITAAALVPGADLLAESPSASDYIPKSGSGSVGSSEGTLLRAATAGHDLQPLGDDPDTGGEDDLLADILTESLLAAPL
ncbi:MAG: lectin-like protein [Phycisphaerae bacterium]|jgi:hypothetical protein|nr:lectin-like protein [Phycisphaerae bacterium]